MPTQLLPKQSGRAPTRLPRQSGRAPTRRPRLPLLPRLQSGLPTVPLFLPPRQAERYVSAGLSNVFRVSPFLKNFLNKSEGARF